MTRWRFARLLAAAMTVTWLEVALADDVTVIQKPENPDVTVITQPAAPEPGAKVTIIKDSGTETHVVHEAVVGIHAPKTAIVIKETPPEPKHEVVETSTRPAEDFVWVPGYWRWDTDRNTYEWISGTWRRTIPGEAWHPGHWQKTDTGYVWINGYWAPESTADTSLVMVKEAPPSVKVETKPASPGADYIWIPGYWAYKDGQYTWTAGRWERPPSAGMVWLPGQWVDTGAGYAYVAGHWDYPEETRTVVVQREP